MARKSLPTRERELKQRVALLRDVDDMSLPTRERELKLAEVVKRGLQSRVAPYTGA